MTWEYVPCRSTWNKGQATHFLVLGVARRSCDCNSGYGMARGVLDRDQGLSAIETPFVLA
jgi:hypothetical protein